MPRTAITATQLATNAAVAPTAFAAADAVNGMLVSAGVDGRLFLYVKNGAGASMNVTVKGRNNYDNLVTAVPATSDRLIGPLESGLYEQTDENLYVDFSTATSVTIAAMRLPK